ncbi:MAG: hypothetical protein ACN4GZ_16325, partial [Acidimicrobiales bacterium]
MTTLAMVAALLVGTVLATPAATSATPPAPGVVFDNFDDGDATDWGFFSGNAAGGGGGAGTDQ